MQVHIKSIFCTFFSDHLTLWTYLETAIYSLKNALLKSLFKASLFFPTQPQQLTIKSSIVHSCILSLSEFHVEAKLMDEQKTTKSVPKVFLGFDYFVATTYLISTSGPLLICLIFTPFFLFTPRWSCAGVLCVSWFFQGRKEGWSVQMFLLKS